MEDNHKICRICLENHNTLFSLHGRLRGVSPYDKLNKINISIELDQADKSCICLQCLSDLDTAVSFFEKCKRANEIIATRISQKSHVQVPIADKCKDVLDFNNLDTNLELHNETVPEPEIEVKDLFSNTKSIDFEEKQKCLHCGSKSRCRHRAPAKKHTCQYCQKVFNRKFNFKLHLKRHLGERDWPCPSCGVQQITRSLAERHCAVKPRKPCPFSGCGKSFTTITNLNTHIRVHNGEKPFKCDECGKGFASKTRLGDHVRIHTGEKPYICPVCGKQFTTNRLTVHMWTHAEASSRPYACHKAGCAKRFSTKTALQLHARVHGRPARAHACSLCDAAYNHRQSLNKHIKKHHRQKSPEPPDSANRHSDHSACHTL